MAAVDPPRLILSRRLRAACVALQVVPLPGLGAIIAGQRNPHTRLRARGIAQATLVVFGSWPLILPGAAGLAWAVWDAVRIAQWSQPPDAWSEPAPDADPETVDEGARRREARAQRRLQRQEARAERRLQRREARARRSDDPDDDTRYLP